jgi:DNA-binding MarR family transcriptional regulator
MDWSDELHAVLLGINGYMNRPDIDRAFLARAGVKLDRALFPLLTRIGLYRPIGVVELANLTGRDHSVVSRQVAKLETLGLVERRTAMGDQRVRLLEPSASGQAMLDRFAAARRDLMAEHLEDWTDAERTQLLDLLRRFSAAIADPGRTTGVLRRASGVPTDRKPRPKPPN